MKNKTPFYNKFVYEENINNIADFELYKKLWMYFITIPLFLMISVGIITLSGYNLKYLTSIVGFIFASLSLLITINCVRGFISCDKKYHIFKKHWYLIVFLAVYFVIAIVFYILPIFTVEYSIDNYEYEYLTHANVAFYFLIYFPLSLVHFVFSYYAYGKCLAKYVRIWMRHNKALEQQKKETEINNEKESEDDTTDSSEQ